MDHPQSFHSVRHAVSTGSLTCSDLVDSFLARIEETLHHNWFVEVYADEAKRRAQDIDRKLEIGETGPLAGMVVGVKDVIAHEGHGLQAASNILEGFTAAFNATVVDRLLEADAIIIGRQNCDEFAMGSSNEHGVYGAASNPVDSSRVPGGSSGASAATVAAGCCHVSIGSDTGGSVRQPAAFCGTVGMKPTYGRVSRWGLIAYASSFDQIGPIAHSVEDIALVLDVIAGEDQRDHTLSDMPLTSTAMALEMPLGRPLRIGVMEEAMQPEGMDPDILIYFEHVKDLLKKHGHEVEFCSFPLLPALVPCYYILTTAEASSNLNRYDGVHYGRRADTPQDLITLYSKSRSEGFGTEVQKRIILGSFVLSEGYVDAYFIHAQKVRKRIAEETLALFEQYDILLSPTAPTAAFQQGEKLDDPVSMYLSDMFTVHANLVGSPAISLPLGPNSKGLPLGLQLMSAPWREELLLRASLDLLPEGKPAIFPRQA